MIILISSLTISFLGRFTITRTLLLNITIITIRQATILLNIAITEVAIGNIIGVSITILIRTGNHLFLRVGRSFRAKISRSSLIREVIVVFYSLVA